jgi:hypothetical protein
MRVKIDRRRGPVADGIYPEINRTWLAERMGITPALASRYRALRGNRGTVIERCRAAEEKESKESALVC